MRPRQDVTVLRSNGHFGTGTSEAARSSLAGIFSWGRPITHKVPLEKAPQMDKTFRDKLDGCIISPRPTLLQDTALKDAG